MWLMYYICNYIGAYTHVVLYTACLVRVSLLYFPTDFQVMAVILSPFSRCVHHPGPSFENALMYGTYFVAIIVPLILVVHGFYQMYSYLLLPDRADSAAEMHRIEKFFGTDEVIVYPCICYPSISWVYCIHLHPTKVIQCQVLPGKGSTNWGCQWFLDSWRRGDGMLSCSRSVLWPCSFSCQHSSPPWAWSTVSAWETGKAMYWRATYCRLLGSLGTAMANLFHQTNISQMETWPSK